MPLQTTNITRASHGSNQGDIARWVDLFAQAANVYVDQIGAGVKVITPDFFENHHPRQDLPGVAHEEFQQFVFGGQQREQLPVAAGFVADQVQFQIRYP